MKRSPHINTIQPHLKMLYICDTSCSLDKAATNHHISCSPDCTVYDEVYNHITHTDSTISNLYVKVKGKAEDDTFLTNFLGKQPSTLNPLMSKTAKGASTASQITTYMALQLDSQYCTHVFSVLIVRDYAWLFFLHLSMLLWSLQPYA